MPIYFKETILLDWIWTALGVAFVLSAITLLIAYVCYRLAFHVTPDQKTCKEEYPIPPGEIYEPFREVMTKWIQQTRKLPHEDFSIRSHDGLTLWARYYEFAPGAPIELMFHGYRGNAERDLCGGVQRCFALGRSALIVDQRACGRSDGHVITFGVKEYRDCLDWLKFAIDHFGPEQKFILTGISMGASTVLNAAGTPLPDCVIGILADCGFDSPENIMKKVIREDMHLPPNLSYPFVRLGAKLFGHFDPDEIASIDAVKMATVPVIFYHGENDVFVPCSMSRANYEACASRKCLVTIPGAGHGLSYPVAPQHYRDTLRDFFGPEASAN